MMTLWVRSQDKRKLVCNPSLEVDGCFILDARTPYLTLGEYDTKEQCIAILEKIYNAIISSGAGVTITYSMPLEVKE